jgi:hypothetical protein
MIMVGDMIFMKLNNIKSLKMKKIVSIVSLIITIGALISAVLIYTKFHEKDYYIDFDINKATEIQKIVRNPSSGSSPEIDLHNDFSNEDYVDLEKVSEELENRGDIIDRSRKNMEGMFLLLGILVISNIYFLIISFRNNINN